MSVDFGWCSAEGHAVFEFTNNAANIWANQAYRSAQDADQARSETAQVAARRDELADIARHNTAIALEERAKVKELTAEVERLKDLLAMKQGRIAGLEAQTKAYREQHPVSPLRTDIGRRYKDGEVKLPIAIIFEEAFDRALRQQGIADPVSRRDD
jgi:hypothetical protein